MLIFHRKNKISINDSKQMKEIIKDHSKEAHDAVIVILDHISHTLNMKTGN